MFAMCSFLCWQVLMVRLWQNLNQWLKDLESLTNWPVQPLDSQSVATIWAGSDRLLEKDWSGLQLYIPAAASTTLSPSKAGLPSPETTTDSSCICRWTVWRLKILLFIIVLEIHSDWSVFNSCTKTSVFTFQAGRAEEVFPYHYLLFSEHFYWKATTIKILVELLWWQN